MKNDYEENISREFDRVRKKDQKQFHIQENRVNNKKFKSVRENKPQGCLFCFMSHTIQNLINTDKNKIEIYDQDNKKSILPAPDQIFMEHKDNNGVKKQWLNKQQDFRVIFGKEGFYGSEKQCNQIVQQLIPTRFNQNTSQIVHHAAQQYRTKIKQRILLKYVQRVIVHNIPRMEYFMIMGRLNQAFSRIKREQRKQMSIKEQKIVQVQLPKIDYQQLFAINHIRFIKDSKNYNFWLFLKNLQSKVRELQKLESKVLINMKKIKLKQFPSRSCIVKISLQKRKQQKIFHFTYSSDNEFISHQNQHIFTNLNQIISFQVGQSQVNLGRTSFKKKKVHVSQLLLNNTYGRYHIMELLTLDQERRTEMAVKGLEEIGNCLFFTSVITPFKQIALNNREQALQFIIKNGLPFTDSYNLPYRIQLTPNNYNKYLQYMSQPIPPKLTAQSINQQIFIINQGIQLDRGRLHSLQGYALELQDQLLQECGVSQKRFSKIQRGKKTLNQLLKIGFYPRSRRQLYQALSNLPNLKQELLSQVRLNCYFPHDQPINLAKILYQKIIYLDSQLLQQLSGDLKQFMRTNAQSNRIVLQNILQLYLSYMAFMRKKALYIYSKQLIWITQSILAMVHSDYQMIDNVNNKQERIIFQSFWLLVCVVNLPLAKYYKILPSSKGLEEDLHFLKLLIRKQMPEANFKLNKMRTSVQNFFSQIMLKMFSGYLLTQSLLRIWDMLFYYSYNNHNYIIPLVCSSLLLYLQPFLPRILNFHYYQIPINQFIIGLQSTILQLNREVIFQSLSMRQKYCQEYMSGWRSKYKKVQQVMKRVAKKQWVLWEALRQDQNLALKLKDEHQDTIPEIRTTKFLQKRLKQFQTNPIKNLQKLLHCHLFIHKVSLSQGFLIKPNLLILFGRNNVEINLKNQTQNIYWNAVQEYEQIGLKIVFNDKLFEDGRISLNNYPRNMLIKDNVLMLPSNKIGINKFTILQFSLVILDGNLRKPAKANYQERALLQKLIDYPITEKNPTIVLLKQFQAHFDQLKKPFDSFQQKSKDIEHFVISKLQPQWVQKSQVILQDLRNFFYSSFRSMNSADLKITWGLIYKQFSAQSEFKLFDLGYFLVAMILSCTATFQRKTVMLYQLLRKYGPVNQYSVNWLMQIINKLYGHLGPLPQVVRSSIQRAKLKNTQDITQILQSYSIVNMYLHANADIVFHACIQSQILLDGYINGYICKNGFKYYFEYEEHKEKLGFLYKDGQSNIPFLMRLNQNSLSLTNHQVMSFQEFFDLLAKQPAFGYLDSYHLCQSLMVNHQEINDKILNDNLRRQLHEKEQRIVMQIYLDGNFKQELQIMVQREAELIFLKKTIICNRTITLQKLKQIHSDDKVEFQFFLGQLQLEKDLSLGSIVNLITQTNYTIQLRYDCEAAVKQEMEKPSIWAIWQHDVQDKQWKEAWLQSQGQVIFKHIPELRFKRLQSQIIKM